MKRPFGLTARVALIFYTIVLLLLLSLGAGFYAFIKRNVETSLRASMEWSVARGMDAARDLFDRIDMYMRLLNSEESVLLDILRTEGDAIATRPQFLRLKSLLTSYLRTAVGQSAGFNAAFLIDGRMPLASVFPKYGRYVLQTNAYEPTAWLSAADLFVEEDWYLAAQSAPNQTVWFALDEMPDFIYGARELTYATVANGRVETVSLGVALVYFEAAWIDQDLRDGQLTQNARVTLQTGDIPLYGEAIFFQAAEATTVWPDGQTHLLWSRAMDDTLRLSILVPQAEINRLAIQSTAIVGLAVGVALLAGAALILIFSRVVVRPIARLSAQMQAGTPPPDAPAEQPASREVETLYQSYRQLLHRNQALIKDVTAGEQARRATEIRLLQAQINPHFIYNTLDTVCCMAMLSRKPDIANMLSDLSAILRYNIKNPDALTPFATEMKIIACSIRIHEARLAKAVTFDADWQTAAQCLLPKMIVQPLVENSLTHVPGVPQISLTARIQKGVLSIRIVDSGRGVDIASINDHIKGKKTLESRSTGLGVRSVDQRIRMRFGDDFGLRFETDAQGATVALLTLPVLFEDAAPKP